MKCPQCGFENVDSSTHCLNCGARMDGNLICPKCGETISPDFDRCPHCHHKIPHQSLKESTKEYTKKDRVHSIFNKIFLIVIIVLLATSMAAVWSDYLNFVKGGVEIKGYASYFLFQSWGDMLKELEPLSDPFQKTSVYFEYISQFVVIVLNMAATYLFGIIGIVASGVALKKQGLKECKTYKFLAIVFISNLITMMYLFSLHSNSILVLSDLPKSTLSYFSGSLSAMFVMSAFSIVIRHENGKRSPTFEKIIFTVNVFIAIAMIVTLGVDVLINKDVSYSLRNGSLFLAVLNDASWLRNTSDGIALLVASGALLVMATLEVLSLSVLVIFFSTGFFTEKERSMKFKIPCYAFSLVSFLVSIIVLGLSIAATVFIIKIYGGNYVMGPMSFVNIGLGILLFGAGVASLMISRIYRKFERLADQTTKK